MKKQIHESLLQSILKEILVLVLRCPVNVAEDRSYPMPDGLCINRYYGGLFTMNLEL